MVVVVLVMFSAQSKVAVVHATDIEILCIYSHVSDYDICAPVSCSLGIPFVLVPLWYPVLTVPKFFKLCTRSYGLSKTKQTFSTGALLIRTRSYVLG